AVSAPGLDCPQEAVRQAAPTPAPPGPSVLRHAARRGFRGRPALAWPVPRPLVVVAVPLDSRLESASLRPFAPGLLAHGEWARDAPSCLEGRVPSMFARATLGGVLPEGAPVDERPHVVHGRDHLPDPDPLPGAPVAHGYPAAGAQLRRRCLHAGLR